MISVTLRLTEPFANTDKNSFMPATSRQWNVLPRYIFKSNTTDAFKSNPIILLILCIVFCL